MSEENKNTPIAEEKSAPAPRKKLSKKQLIIIIAAAAAVVIAAVVLIVVFTAGKGGESDDEYEYIDVTAVNYYAGVVEPEETSEIYKDSERTVKDIYVKEGDSVKKGDKLFAYDSEEIANKLANAKIDLDSYQNTIDAADTTIAQLTRDRANAEADAQLEYTTQIQEKENEKSQAQLNLQKKQVEIDNYQSSLDNSVITSPIDGIVKSINNSEDASTGAFMTVLMNGSFRVKGSVDENNIRSLSEGMDVIVHSRVDDKQTWNGKITKRDTSDTVDNKDNNNSMMNGGDNSNGSTKYNFYIELENSDGLLMGEHVYIEPVFNYADDNAPDDEAADTADAAEDAAPASQAEAN